MKIKILDVTRKWDFSRVPPKHVDHVRVQISEGHKNGTSTTSFVIEVGDEVDVDDVLYNYGDEE